MTKLQFERWRVFALGMANGYPYATKARKELIAKYVDHFLSCVEGECEEYDSWDGGPSYLCDRFSEWSDCLPGFWRINPRRSENWKFRNQVCCCIRAGIDVVAEPSAGVLGFTAGHLRSWFGWKLPDWVKEFFKDGAIDDVPDDAPVWL